MIIDRIDQAERYDALHPSFAKAFATLRSYLADDDLSCGKHVLDGEKLYAMVQEYTTHPKDGMKFESHERYIDIQFILSGKEEIDACPADTLPLTDPYSKENDCALYGTGSYTPILLQTGDFAIFYPNEAHRPAIAVHGKPEQVKKVIVKVLAE